MYHIDENTLLYFLVQLSILLLFSKIFSIFFEKLKQPTVTGDLLVGILFGPTILKRISPILYYKLFPESIIQKNMLETVGWIGILFLLLSIGLEVNFSSVWKQKKDALIISTCDIIFPILISGLFLWFLPDKYIVNKEMKILFIVFISTIMTISAMTVTIRAITELKILKSDLGFLIVSALSINDIIGWLVFTIVLGLFLHSKPDLFKLFFIIFTTISFTILALTVVKAIMCKIFEKLKKSKFDFTSLSLSIVLILGMIFGSITTIIGIHALFGFFLAGLVSGESKDISQKTRSVIHHMVYSIFVPLFFVNIGLKIDFFSNFDLFLTLFIFFIGIIARFFGAWIGASFSKVYPANKFFVSFAHIPGGEMHVVVGLLALESGLINETMFVSIVFSAMASAIIVGPLLYYSLKLRKKVEILEYFNVNNILMNISDNNKEKCIELLSHIASEWSGIDFNEINNKVLEREDIISTGIEEGIAIPHARINGLRYPLIIVGHSISGIEWDTPDGKLVNLVFMILLPDDKEVDYDSVQINILKTIISRLLDSKIRNKLISAKTNEQFFTIIQNNFRESIININNKK